MHRPIRYGMVGGGPGAMAGDAHRRAIALDGLARLEAGCFSQSIENTRAIGRALGLNPARLYASFDEMARLEAAREDGIDFAVVVTPNDAHYAACRAFLEAGIHVVCDKPLCLTSAQGEALLSLAGEKGLLFMVTYTYAGYAIVKHARDLVAGGAIGRVRTVVAEYPQGWLARAEETGGKQGAWRCDPSRSGQTNCLGDLGTHVENLAQTVTGLKIKRVLARMDSVVPGRVLDDNDFVMVEYEGGATGMYWSSQIAVGCDNGLRLRVYGEEGSLEWFQERPEVLEVARLDGTRTQVRRGQGISGARVLRYNRLPTGHPEGWIEAMANLYVSFVGCLRALDQGALDEALIDFPTVRQGLDGVRFVEACLLSSAQGNRWVDVEG